MEIINIDENKIIINWPNKLLTHFSLMFGEHVLQIHFTSSLDQVPVRWHRNKELQTLPS